MIENKLNDFQQAITGEGKNDLEKTASQTPYSVLQPIGTIQFNENLPYKISYSLLPFRTKLEIKILKAIGNATSFLYNLFSN